MATDFLNVTLYCFKFLAGLLYIMATSCPPKKDYEYLYKGMIGHHMWRVNRVKNMRKYLTVYFIISTVTVLFQLLNGLVIDMCFFIFKILDFRYVKFIITVLIAIYQILYSLRKIKSHLKELESLVTIRFEEALQMKLKTAIRKLKRKEKSLSK
jgi:hypothetical protein